ncbi:hypothetical protein ACQEU5_19215 [Marinactinospora thermotolerans]|uniref:Uncharacterized protein n=1 Tax=Marinactinospora thermotolerans DSM 45154 TaxID=1122192 RepID=A0A1T4NIA0_9ACTN|nr:hypothetical protein [Marinactinospora thermotolerans]SJZ78944.1 hypothetical protein SAMN02745673_01461 [Marinactinospora thermotolerans DSM 45154]
MSGATKPDESCAVPDEHYAAFCRVSEAARRLGLGLRRDADPFGWTYTLTWPTGHTEDYPYLGLVQDRLRSLQPAVGEEP